MHYGGRATPSRYVGAPGISRHHTPAPVVSLLLAQETRKVVGDIGSKQALYRLLGQDLDTCVEAHADAYEQAKKKWADCPLEEWVKGGDGMLFVRL